MTGSLDALARLRAWTPSPSCPATARSAAPNCSTSTRAICAASGASAADGIAAGLTPLETAREAAPDRTHDLLDAERLVPNLHRAYAEELGAAPGDPLDIPRCSARWPKHHGGLPVCRA
ncbi:hypothetical protein [Streptomyces sp. KL116D]|uniref:hypothetical protein n=1 Tax=Streptomyces sp. KL116D TaxID=3045152 RepID=UPI0035591B9C